MSETRDESMEALVLHAPGDIRHERVPAPATTGEALRGKARVRIGFCGVCGSDIPRIFTKGTYHFPTICGHEFAGTVESVGEGSDTVRTGDRVAVFPLIWCGRCGPCERGQYVQCTDYDYLGSRSDGAFAEYVVAPLENLIPIPDAVSLEEAAMTEPAAVALHAVRRGGGTSVGEAVAIFGIGPIGLMVAQWVRALGATRVFLFDIDTDKLALAKRLGFTEVFDSREVDPVRTVEEATAGQGAHLAFDGAGVPSTLLQAFAATRRAGRVVLLGNPAADVTVPAPLLSQLMRREVGIFGTWNSEFSAFGNDDDWRTVLEAMASGRLDLKPLITHSVPLSRAIERLEAMRDRSEFYSKVLLHP